MTPAKGAGYLALIGAVVSGSGVMNKQHFYIAIDMKSFYASCEAVAMGLDPLKVKLLVADESRSDQTICLAVSPSLKAIGVPGRPRLFEAKQSIRRYELRTGTRVRYITPVPFGAPLRDCWIHCTQVLLTHPSHKTMLHRSHL